MSLPCPSVPKINFASPSSVHDGGVKASISDNDEGSNGLYGVINSTKKEQKTYVEECFEDYSIPIVASTDYMRSYAEQIRPYVNSDYTVLGTDGFGRSDSRKNLREFFEIDANSITRAAIYTLYKNKIIDKAQLKKVYDDIEVDPLKPNPWEV